MAPAALGATFDEKMPTIKGELRQRPKHSSKIGRSGEVRKIPRDLRVAVQ
jgi:hypothetical protein